MSNAQNGCKSPTDSPEEPKFHSPTKVKARERAWPGLRWTHYFAHGKVKHPEELLLIHSHGIEIVRFYDVLASLCANIDKAPKGGAGTDIAEMISFYESFRETAA